MHWLYLLVDEVVSVVADAGVAAAVAAENVVDPKILILF